MRNILPFRLDELFGWHDRIQIPDNWHDLHQMRISAKRLRYSMELYQVCFDRHFKETIETIKMIQDFLGDIHDCDMMIEYLEEIMHPDKFGLHDGKPTGNRAGHQLPEIQAMITEQIQSRKQLYNQFIVFWNELLQNRFKEQLLSQIDKTYIANVDRTNDLNMMERIFIDSI
jgi:CHAD domain-containing protein